MARSTVARLSPGSFRWRYRETAFLPFAAPGTRVYLIDTAEFQNESLSKREGQGGLPRS